MSEKFLEFKITNYDIENEFNVNRPVKRLSKDQQLFGIWARDSDDENEVNHCYPKHRKKYSEPVHFVPGGVQQPNHEKNRDKGQHCGKEKKEEENTVSASCINISISSSDETDDENYRSEIGQHCKFLGETNIVELPFCPENGSSSSIFTRKDVGSWERHTKGIGTKLLLQMGFQPGRGLGKDLQGISTPIEAHQRSGRAALGAYGPERDVTWKGCKPENNHPAKKTSQWRCENVFEKKRKVQYMFKTDPEITKLEKLKPNRDSCNHLNRIKIIDRTGPEPRVLLGYSSTTQQYLMQEEWISSGKKIDSSFTLPELEHNINLLNTIHREKVEVNEFKLKELKNQNTNLQEKISKLDDCLLQEAKEMETLENILIIMESMIDESNNQVVPLSLNRISEYLKELQTKYYEEYILYDISSFASQIVISSFEDAIKYWEPFKHPDEPMELFKHWREILERTPSSVLSCRDTTGAYNLLLWNCWLPHIRAAIESWDIRRPEPLQPLLDVWRPLLPLGLQHWVLSQLVLPRLQQGVEEWDPHTDCIPIHEWVLPWASVLDEQLRANVYPVIKCKLAAALVTWHPSDQSARLMLQPWSEAFTHAEMDAFLALNIVPKLQQCLQDLALCQQEPRMERWNWVMDWEGVLSKHSLVSLLDHFFFPNWLQVLAMWMSSNPNYDEVCSWYLGWKSMFSESLLADPTIKEQFRKAVYLMQQLTWPRQSIAQTSGARECIQENPAAEQMFPSQRNCEASSYTSRHIDAAEVAKQIAFPQTFKDLLVKHCETLGITFAPLPNRHWEGKQVYRCGKLQIYIDKNVIFVHQNETMWYPTSLKSLLEMAQ